MESDYNHENGKAYPHTPAETTRIQKDKLHPQGLPQTGDKVPGCMLCS